MKNNYDFEVPKEHMTLNDLFELIERQDKKIPIIFMHMDLDQIFYNKNGKYRRNSGMENVLMHIDGFRNISQVDSIVDNEYTMKSYKMLVIWPAPIN